jgi:hypothetical protein
MKPLALLAPIMVGLTAGVNALAPSSAATAATGEVEVVGMDYAFNIPRELPAGRTTFRFRNAGKVPHELNIALLRAGATVQQFMAAANASKPLSSMIDAPVGVLFAKPGQRSPSALSTELLTGRTYVVICIFRDSTKAPKHHALGMYSAIHVGPRTSGPPARSGAAPRTDTIVAADYAFRYPRTLSPGRHRLAFVNAGKQRHEVNINLFRTGATLAQMAAIDKKGGDVEPLFEQALGVLHSPAGTNPAGVLEVDLLPGRDYLIECGFSDSDTSPPHYTLGMQGVIHVDGTARAKPRAP